MLPWKTTWSYRPQTSSQIWLALPTFRQGPRNHCNSDQTFPLGKRRARETTHYCCCCKTAPPHYTATAKQSLHVTPLLLLLQWNPTTKPKKLAPTVYMSCVVSKQKLQQHWTGTYNLFFLLIIARGVLWLVHYDFVVSALWHITLWHIKYIATT